MKEINRVKKYREFREIMNLRHFKRNALYVVYYCPKKSRFSRVGINVSKKNGIAVVRVKIKRQIRAIIQENIKLRDSKFDYIVVISKDYKTEKFEKNKTLLVNLINSIKEN